MLLVVVLECNGEIVRGRCRIGLGIRVPALVALGHRDLAVMSSLRVWRAQATFQQQALNAQHEVRPR